MTKAGVEKLRESLMDYFGTALSCGNPIATVYLAQTQDADEEELVKIALENGYDLSPFENDNE